MDKKGALDPTEGSAALKAILLRPGEAGRSRTVGHRHAMDDHLTPLRYARRMAGQKSPKQQAKAEASEKAKGTDRDWLTTAELATKIGWREHSLRDALRHRPLEGVHRTAFGYKIGSSAVEAIQKTLGPAPAKGNSSLKARPKA